MPRFTVSDNDANQRADIYVAHKLQGLTRSFIKHLFEQDYVRINAEKKKAGYRLKAGDKIVVTYDESQPLVLNEINVPILYEDDDCIVINKPAGILTHSKGAFNPEATVASWVAPKTTGLQDERGGIVHRLDRATSGVMICAKNPESRTWLQKQFSERKVKKTYLAIVEGVPQPEEAVIDIPIERNPKKPQTFRTGPGGKTAQTHYKVMRSNGGLSLLQMLPQTGRTHQLRVHMKHVGHPIVGDLLYGGKSAERLYLHSLSLEITLPNKMRHIYVAPVPPEFPAIMGDDA